MNNVQTLSSILGLAFTCGINPYLVVLAAGFGMRFNLISGVPDELHVLAHPLVLGVAGLLFACDLIGENFPGFGAIWDSVHTFLRPLAGAFLAFRSAGDLDPAWKALALLVGGGVALTTHSTKSGVRLLSHTSPEPVSNLLLTLVENSGVIGLIWLVYAHPLVALCVVSVLIAITLWLLPLMLRIMRFVFRGMLGRISSWLPGTGAASPPAWLSTHVASLSSAGVYRSFARSLGKAPRMKCGYLVFAQDRHYFAYKGLFRQRVIAIGTPGSTRYSMNRGLIFDVLTVENSGAKTQTMYLPKDASKNFQARGARAETAPGAMVRGIA